MGDGFSLKTIVTAAAISAAAIFPGTASAVPHAGEILGTVGNSLTNIGGVQFSAIHKSNTGSVANGNGFIRTIDGDIEYEWTPNPGAGAATIDSTQLFDRGPVTVGSFTESGGSTFTVRLWTGNAELDVVNYIRADGSAGSNVVTPSSVGLGTFTDTQFARGNFRFEIEETNGGSSVGVLSDIFVFDSSMDMASVDKVGVNADGVTGTFLWGYTSGDDQECLEGVCTNITDTVFGTAGLGIDIAYSGSLTDVPEPGALALFGLGLLGMGIVGRRRKPV